MKSKPLVAAARSVFLALVFLGALAGMSKVLDAWTPVPRMSQVTEKLEKYASATRPFDALIFGSSRFYHGVIPELFDKELKRQGEHLNTFNFAVDGMAFPETAYYCEKALAHRNPKLRYVFVELTPVRARIPAALRGTRRLLYWHDWPRTAVTLRTLREDAPTWSALNTPTAMLLDETPAALMIEHLRIFFHCTTRLGDGADLVQRLLGQAGVPEREIHQTEPWVGNGYSPIRVTMPEKDRPAWEKTLGAFRETETEPPSLVAEEAFRALERKVHAAGAHLILVTFPNYVPNRRIFAGNAQRAPTVFAFDLPDAYPDLYWAENRESAIHVNDAGAREFTKALAERFVIWRKSEGRNLPLATRP